MSNIKYVAKYSCQLVKEPTNEKFFINDMQINNPSDAARIIRDMTKIDACPSEQVWVIFLNTHSQAIGFTMASSGGISSSVADVREVFRASILANAKAVIICHNHPSGSAHKSEEDMKTTIKLKTAGEILGVNVLDHIIIGENEYYSFKEHGLCKL